MWGSELPLGLRLMAAGVGLALSWALGLIQPVLYPALTLGLQEGGHSTHHISSRSKWGGAEDAQGQGAHEKKNTGVVGLFSKPSMGSKSMK